MVDKVEFKDFAPNEQVKMTAVDMDKSTKSAVKLGDNYLMGQTIFTPKAADGSIDVNMASTSTAPDAKYVTAANATAGKAVTETSTTKSAADVLNDSKTASSASDASSSSDSSKASDSSASGSSKVASDTSSSASSKSSKASSASDSVSKVSKASESDASSASDSTHKDKATSYNANADVTTGSSDVDVSALKSDAEWTAYETAETAPANGTGSVIAEHKDLNSADQTITIKLPVTPKGSTNTPSGSSNGSGTTSTPNSQSGSNPAFAQTGATAKVSHNAIYNFFARLLHW